MTLLRSLLPAVLLALPPGLCACGGGGGPAAASTPRTPTFDFASGHGISDAQLGDYHVALEVALDGERVGELIFTLWPEAFPRSVRRFLRLCDEGYYDGLTFHRVMREFVLQGGDPNHDGTGRSHYGDLPQKFSLDEEYEHHYGVLSFTDPPSMQFFVCLAESPKVWALDQQPYNGLGQLVHGVQALEYLANAHVAINNSGERSAPLQALEIVTAAVRAGSPAFQEPIVRPRPALAGQPEFVTVQRVLVTFLERARGRNVTRNRVEAAASAQDLLERIRSGELDFVEAMRTRSDEVVSTTDVQPGLQRISNYGVVDVERQRARQDGQREMTLFRTELRQLLAGGAITQEEFVEEQRARAQEITERVKRLAVDRREDLAEPGLADVAFGLEVGEAALVPYHMYDSPAGWIIVRRVE